MAIAFFFGAVVQFVSRTIFSFNYKSNLKWKIGLFGGICATAIVYFLLIKGAKGLSFMTPEVAAWIDGNTALIIGSCLLVSTLLMQLLHILGVNVLKVIVLMGTFSLAVAFAGNDLVNFIGVPLSGLSSYQDYVANGGGDAHGFMMGSLNAPASTPLYFLIGAGMIMVVSLATSKKARKVTKTEIGLGSHGDGDEMFGSSRIARRLVRWTLSLIALVRRITPLGVRRWFNRRFNVDETIMDQGAAFDLVRGSVNLVLAGALIALGTSMKLPLSTTFVTFMVAMGSSLADKAWTRESAVFRITGVISVVGGWFLTAGAAFIGAGLIVALMHWGGIWAMFAFVVTTVAIIIRSNRRFKKKNAEESGDALFQSILSTDDKEQCWSLLQMYITDQQRKFLEYSAECYRAVTEAFIKDDVRTLGKVETSLRSQKTIQKSARRKETLCLRRISHETAIKINAWFYLGNNCCMSMLYNLGRINEICKEHVENNFRPLPQQNVADYEMVRTRVSVLFNDMLAMIDSGQIDTVRLLRRHCDEIKDVVSDTYHRLYNQLREDDPAATTVLYVYLNMLQETQEMVSSIRKYLRAFAKLRDSDFRTRPAKIMVPTV